MKGKILEKLMSSLKVPISWISGIIYSQLCKQTHLPIIPAFACGKPLLELKSSNIICLMSSYIICVLSQSQVIIIMGMTGFCMLMVSSGFSGTISWAEL